jgi:Family of unknown function (DUF6491)
MMSGQGRASKETAMKKTVLAGLGFALLAFPVLAQPRCLQIGQIWSWKPLNSRTLIVEDNYYQKFKVGLEGFCPALPYKLNLGFQSLSGINGLDCLHRGDQVISRDVGVRYTCPIMSITPYTPARERADQAAAAAKQ